VARWSVTSGVAGEVETTGEVRALHPEVEVTLLRVAQEALANVAKHASASRAGVTLSYMEDVVSLDVRDDGVGFAEAECKGHPNGETPAAGGFGLIAMRQRVSRLAGQLEIESEPSAGTAVSASPPGRPPGRRRPGSRDVPGGVPKTGRLRRPVP
jgi:signal transduction histidine kinase